MFKNPNRDISEFFPILSIQSLLSLGALLNARDDSLKQASLPLVAKGGTFLISVIAPRYVKNPTIPMLLTLMLEFLC